MTDRERVCRSWGGVDRRGVERIPLHHLVKVQSGSATGEAAVLMNISADGALLLAERYYRRGSTVDVMLNLHSPAATAELCLAGRVMRCASSAEGCTVAIRFDEHALQLSARPARAAAEAA